MWTNLLDAVTMEIGIPAKHKVNRQQCGGFADRIFSVFLAKNNI